METHKCPECRREFPASPAGTLLACPHCHAPIVDETSVFSDETVREKRPSGPVPVVLNLGDESRTASSGEITFPSHPAPIVPGATAPVAPQQRATVPPAVPPSSSPFNSARDRSPIFQQLLLSYASIMTFVCLYLGWQLYRAPHRDLLDLPDLAPPARKDGQVTTLIYVPPSQRLTETHLLKLGESRRFGSVKVTPLSVTRGRLEFRYFDPEIQQHRPPSEQVLKLHVRFENLSNDQVFTPLDRQLVFSREEDPKHADRFKANNFVRRSDDLNESSALSYVYDLSPDSDWTIVNQNLDRELRPGESVDTFIPATAETGSTVPGPLVWRIHFRKGYNPRSYRGITTLVEVKFDSSQILDESLEPAESKVSTSPGKAVPGPCPGPRFNCSLPITRSL